MLSSKVLAHGVAAAAGSSKAFRGAIRVRGPFSVRNPTSWRMDTCHRSTSILTLGSRSASIPFLPKRKHCPRPFASTAEVDHSVTDKSTPHHRSGDDIQSSPSKHDSNKSTSSNGGGNRLPVPDFNDAKAAYESKSNTQLIKAVVTFGLCQIRPLVRRSERLLKLVRQILGDRITDGILKATLFGHFCAGEDEVRIRPTIHQLERVGIGSILDFAAEDDGETSAVSSARRRSSTNVIVDDKGASNHYPPRVRVYDYESETVCDRHVENFLTCIRSVANLQKDGFAAIKVTALGNAKLLARMSRAIAEAQNLFAKFDTNGDGLIGKAEFERGLDLFFVDSHADTNVLKRRVQELMPDFNQAETGYDLGKNVDYITWSMLLAPADLPKITAGCREVGPLALAAPTDEEVELIEKMYERGHTLAREAAACGVRLLIDAEQSRFQPAIDNLVLDLQRTYNAAAVTPFPIIYNTYQCYLKDSTARLRADVQRSERYEYHFGAKLVRGAYMESERALAESMGLPSPIHDTMQDTHDCYNDAVEFLLEQSQKSPSIEFMCATHNQDTIERAIRKMGQLGINPRSNTISFAQLFGMMDNLTFNLGKHGFRAYKYVPYGEVKMVMPYLIRRANENSAIAGGAAKELRMISGELKRRWFGRSI